MNAATLLRGDIREAAARGASYNELRDAAIDSYLENRVEDDEAHNRALLKAAESEVRHALAEFCV